MDSKLSILQAHMNLSVKLPELTNSIFKEHNIVINHKRMNLKANEVTSILRGLNVAEATLILQEILKQTYAQLVIDNNAQSLETDPIYIPEIPINDVSMYR